MARLRIPDQVLSDLGEYLREQREQARLSVRQLAQATGVSNPYLSQIERGLRKPSAEVLQQIAKGLQISAEALYVRAGILEQAVGREVEVAIRTDPTLTERQRRVLLDIYASFQAENGRAAGGSSVVPARPADDAAGASAPAPVIESSPPRAATAAKAAGAAGKTARRAPRKTTSKVAKAAKATKAAATSATSATSATRAGRKAASPAAGPAVTNPTTGAAERPSPERTAP